MKFYDFNNLPKEEAAKHLNTCCGSAQWLQMMMQRFPFSTPQDLLQYADEVWYQRCGANDWLEAFLHHPEIGNLNSLREKFNVSRHLASAEQAGVQSASDNILLELAEKNKEYKEKFGFIFIVFATGKDAEEILALLQHRIINSREDEMQVAMGEQQKITLHRFKGLVEDFELPQSHLTTHVLDTSLGKPAQKLFVQLNHGNDNERKIITSGLTNHDGRVAHLLPPGRILTAGEYTLRFEVNQYYNEQHLQCFYPFIEISFLLKDQLHYHVPLLLNPFGYSTYRGS